MDQAQHSFIVSFIWNIADDVLRDVHARGDHRVRMNKEPAASWR